MSYQGARARLSIEWVISHTQLSERVALMLETVVKQLNLDPPPAENKFRR